MLFRSSQSSLDVVGGDAASVAIRIGVVDLYVFLHIAGTVMCSVRIHKYRCSCFEYGLLRSNTLLQFILGAGGYFFSQLAEPKWSVLRDLLRWGNFRLVIFVVEPE